MRRLPLVMLTLIIALSFVACDNDLPATSGDGVDDVVRPDGTIDVPNPTGDLSKEDFDSVNASMEELYRAVPEWTLSLTQFKVYDVDGDLIVACEGVEEDKYTDFEVHKTLEGMSYFTKGIRFSMQYSDIEGEGGDYQQLQWAPIWLIQ